MTGDDIMPTIATRWGAGMVVGWLVVNWFYLPLLLGTGVPARSPGESVWSSHHPQLAGHAPI